MRNFALGGENRVHRAEGAAQLGFAGAVVPGAAVFGHMTRPVVEAVGAQWLGGYRAEVRFRKPVYDGHRVTIRHTRADGRHQVQCGGKVALATLCSEPLRDAAGTIPDAGRPVGARPAVSWRQLAVAEPFPAWTWHPDAVEAAESAAQVADDQCCYRDGLLHPHAILGAADQAFVHRYLLRSWLLVGARLDFHRPLRAGDAVEVRSVPLRKWRHKGHGFVDLGVYLLVDGALATAIVHTSIVELAARR